MKKIDLLIIGAQKAGTTSLKNYLGQHKNILTHFVTEFSFFKDIIEYEKGFDVSLRKYFKKKNKEEELLLAKNIGLFYDEDALKRIKLHNPNCKLILSLREPVARTISSFKMEVFNGGFNLDFKDVIDAIKNKDYKSSTYKVFVEQSLYAIHLQKIFNHFPREQLMIINYDDFISNPQKECNKILNWVGLEKVITINKEVIHNQTKAPRSKAFSNLLIKLRSNDSWIKRLFKWIFPYSIFTKMGKFLLGLNKSNKSTIMVDPNYSNFLKEYYRPYNEQLKMITGIDFKK